MGFHSFLIKFIVVFFSKKLYMFLKEIIWISLSYIIDTFGFAMKFQNNNANFSRDFFWDNFLFFFVIFYCFFSKGNKWVYLSYFCCLVICKKIEFFLLSSIHYYFLFKFAIFYKKFLFISCCCFWLFLLLLLFCI